MKRSLFVVLGLVVMLGFMSCDNGSPAVTLPVEEPRFISGDLANSGRNEVSGSRTIFFTSTEIRWDSATGGIIASNVWTYGVSLKIDSIVIGTMGWTIEFLSHDAVPEALRGTTWTP